MNGYQSGNWINGAPTDIALSNSVIVEGVDISSVVGTLTTTDGTPAGATFVYSLVSGTGGADNAAFTIVGDELRTAVAVDYETKNSYSVRLRTTDPGGLWCEEVLAIGVLDVDEAPTASPQSVGTTEDAAKSITLVGVDPENAALSYHVVAGPQHGTLSGTGADRLYTPDPHYSGDDSFTFKVNDGSLDSPTVTVSIAVAGVPVLVVGIYARGSGWNAAYLATLETAGMGTAASGFRLVDGSGQLGNAAALTWQNVNQLSVTFSEAVTVSAGSLRLVDSSNADVPLAVAGGFGYNPATYTATWTFVGNLGRNRYLIALDAGTIVDAGGLALDGEWITSQTTYATGGDGTPGGNLFFRFNVLPGDVTLNGQTNTGDAGKVKSYGTAIPNASNYRSDVTGNNQINAGDVGFVRSLGTQTLAGVPEPIIPPGGMSLLRAAGLKTNAAGTVSDGSPSPDDLAAILAVSKARWRQAGWDVAALGEVRLEVVDYADSAALAVSAAGLIRLDDNAAGWGWFVDATPAADEEFAAFGSSLAAADGPAASRIDLLTTVLHELGHQLGVDHAPAGLMDDVLEAGRRWLPPSAPEPAEELAAAQPAVVDAAFLAVDEEQPAGEQLSESCPVEPAAAVTPATADVPATVAAAEPPAASVMPAPTPDVAVPPSPCPLPTPTLAEAGTPEPPPALPPLPSDTALPPADVLRPHWPAPPRADQPAVAMMVKAVDVNYSDARWLDRLWACQDVAGTAGRLEAFPAAFNPASLDAEDRLNERPNPLARRVVFRR